MESGNLQDMSETVRKSRGRGGGRAPGTAELLKQMVNVARRKEGRSREEWAEIQGSHVDRGKGTGFDSRCSGKLLEGFPKLPPAVWTAEAQEELSLGSI